MFDGDQTRCRVLRQVPGVAVTALMDQPFTGRLRRVFLLLDRHLASAVADESQHVGNAIKARQCLDGCRL